MLAGPLTPSEICLKTQLRSLLAEPLTPSVIWLNPQSRPCPLRSLTLLIPRRAALADGKATLAAGLIQVGTLKYHLHEVDEAYNKIKTYLADGTGNLTNLVSDASGALFAASQHGARCQALSSAWMGAQQCAGFMYFATSPAPRGATDISVHLTVPARPRRTPQRG